MKKSLFLFTFALQIVTAQNNIVDEYICTNKNQKGVKLFFLEDNTYQISVFSGKYKIENDSLILENKNIENSFQVLFEKNNTKSDKLTIKVTPNNRYYFSDGEFFGIQKTENSEIEYKSFADYFDEDELENYFENKYEEEFVENKETKSGNSEKKLSFEIDRAAALYFVKYRERKSIIEKYNIPNDVNVIDVTIVDNSLSETNLSGIIEKDKNIIVLADGRNPLRFTKKSAIKKEDYVLPTSKTSEKEWNYPGMKNKYDYAIDTVAATVDTAYAYSDNQYNFKAKIEKSLKESLENIKKDTSKYLVIYNSLLDKKADKKFTEFMESFNTNIGYSMYDAYNATYDKLNFYQATKPDAAFLKKNNLDTKTLCIINNQGKILATSTKPIDNTDVLYFLTNLEDNNIYKLIETENVIALNEAIANKKTSITELTTKLNTNYKDFFSANYYYDNNYYSAAADTATVYTEDIPAKEVNEEEQVQEAAKAVEEAASAAEVVAYPSEINNDVFTFHNTIVSEKILSDKLNEIFQYYNSRNLVNNNLINILLGEISANHITFDLFKNDDNKNNKQEISFINYILKYNENKEKKNKIAQIISRVILQKEDNADTNIYNDIAYKLISFSGNNFDMIQNAINSFNYKEPASEEANKLVDSVYNSLVNNKPVFENLDLQYEKYAKESEYSPNWFGFKSRLNNLFNSQAWDIFELKKTNNYERAIKWSELSNLIEKNNPYSLDTLGQLYFAVGRKAEAIEIQTQAVALAKVAGIQEDYIKFEEALQNMKR